MNLRMILFAALLCYVVTASSNAADPNNSLPKVLVIGDSISIGYQKPLERILAGKAQVIHNRGNAQHTGYGVAHLDEWLGDTKWDVIHFNFGLHDLKYVDDEGKNTRSTKLGHIQIPVKAYRQNLAAIVRRLKQTHAHLIFALTTPFPDEPGGPLRHIADVGRYNEAALEIMKANDIEVDDLHRLVQPRLSELQQPDNVHFTGKGYEVLARQVADHILRALPKK
ncbi:SGNH/GDSL hydrolase family protein [bacterium]|nr:SGNH/GDSL hydrolase family protein [bacterium]